MGNSDIKSIALTTQSMKKWSDTKVKSIGKNTVHFVRKIQKNPKIPQRKSKNFPKECKILYGFSSGVSLYKSCVSYVCRKILAIFGQYFEHDVDPRPPRLGYIFHFFSKNRDKSKEILGRRNLKLVISLC